MAELVSSGVSTPAGMAGNPCSKGGVPGTDHAAQRPLRLAPARPLPGSSRRSPGSHAGCEPDTPGFPRCAPTWGGSSSGTGRRPRSRRSPAGSRRPHRVQAPRPEPERRVPFSEGAVDILLVPGRPGPQRRLVEPRHGSGGDQGPDQPHHVRGQRRCLRQAGMDEPVRYQGAGHVGDQLRHRSTGHAGRRPGKPPGHAAAARRTARNPARRPGGPRHAPGRRRTSTRAGRAAPVPPPRPGSPPADRTGQPPGQRHPPDQGRRSTRPRDGDPRSGPGPPTSWTSPGCPAASRASSSPPAQRPAASNTYMPCCWLATTYC